MVAACRMENTKQVPHKASKLDLMQQTKTRRYKSNSPGCCSNRATWWILVHTGGYTNAEEKEMSHQGGLNFRL